MMNQKTNQWWIEEQINDESKNESMMDRRTNQWWIKDRINDESKNNLMIRQRTNKWWIKEHINNESNNESKINQRTNQWWVKEQINDDSINQWWIKEQINDESKNNFKNDESDPDYVMWTRSKKHRWVRKRQLFSQQQDGLNSEGGVLTTGGEGSTMSLLWRTTKRHFFFHNQD